MASWYRPQVFARSAFHAPLSIWFASLLLSRVFWSRRSRQSVWVLKYSDLAKSCFHALMASVMMQSSSGFLSCQSIHSCAVTSNLVDEQISPALDLHQGVSDVISLFGGEAVPDGMQIVEHAVSGLFKVFRNSSQLFEGVQEVLGICRFNSCWSPLGGSGGPHGTACPGASRLRTIICFRPEAASLQVYLIGISLGQVVIIGFTVTQTHQEAASRLWNAAGEDSFFRGDLLLQRGVACILAKHNSIALRLGLRLCHWRGGELRCPSEHWRRAAAP